MAYIIGLKFILKSNMKTPQEKADELVDKMYNVDFHDDASEISMCYPHAIKCALIAVEEILNVGFFDTNDLYDYWHQVKEQIKNL